MLPIASARRRCCHALCRTIAVSSALVVCALVAGDAAYAVPQDRLSWITRSDTESAYDFVQSTVDIGTTDESVQHWLVAGDAYTVVGDGPVSPDGYQRVDDRSYSLGGLGFSDAAGIRPVGANSHHPWSDQAPPEGLDQWLSETEWDPSGAAFYADMTEIGWEWPPTTESSIVRVDLNGQEITPVVDFPEVWGLDGPRAPTVEADGSHVAFVTQVDPAGDPTGSPIDFGPFSIAPVGLYVAGSDGASPTALIDGEDWLSILQPDFSPDGSEVVFTGVTSNFTIGVFKVSTVSGIVTQLAGMDYYGYSVAKWSPDGQYIAYADGTATEDDPLRIVLMDADGANERTLDTLPEGTDVDTVMTSFSFLKSSTDADPGPGPFPIQPSESAAATASATVARAQTLASSGGSGRVSPQPARCGGGRPGSCAIGDQRDLRRIQHLCHVLDCGRDGIRRHLAGRGR
jgi:hypothetical protein